jgi:hypothetical protein
MVFQITANATFEAKSIDEALQKLGRHFMGMAKKGVDEPDLFVTGHIEVSKVEG